MALTDRPGPPDLRAGTNPRDTSAGRRPSGPPRRRATPRGGRPTRKSPAPAIRGRTVRNAGGLRRPGFQAIRRLLCRLSGLRAARIVVRRSHRQEIRAEGKERRILRCTVISNRRLGPTPEAGPPRVEADQRRNTAGGAGGCDWWGPRVVSGRGSGWGRARAGAGPFRTATWILESRDVARVGPAPSE